jgi:hypothetical protein
LRVGGVFLDADVGDVRLLELPLLVDLGEAALGDAPSFVIEALGARHAGRRGARAGGRGRTSWSAGRRASAGTTSIAQAVGVVVARASVHGGLYVGTLHHSTLEMLETTGPVSRLVRLCASGGLGWRGHEM